MSVIEVTIPLRYVQQQTDDDDSASDVSITTTTGDVSVSYHECVICMHLTCNTKECGRAPTQTSCCSQVLCCACFVKLMRRCKCTSGCRAIVGTCPFCRDMMRAENPLQVFLATIPVCRKCVASQHRRSLDRLSDAVVTSSTASSNPDP